MVKMLSQSDKLLRRKHESSVRTNRQTNKQMDPNAIPSPSARVIIISNRKLYVFRGIIKDTKNVHEELV